MKATCTQPHRLENEFQHPHAVFLVILPTLPKTPKPLGSIYNQFVLCGRNFLDIFTGCAEGDAAWMPEKSLLSKLITPDFIFLWHLWVTGKKKKKKVKKRITLFRQEKRPGATTTSAAANQTVLQGQLDDDLVMWRTVKKVWKESHVASYGSVVAPHRVPRKVSEHGLEI